ncbi:MAG TPA: hypothetical protein VMH87_15470 [Pseudomonadales bacterium]|nr:hypothetical protein [Pseudomonadales bacterium]
MARKLNPAKMPRIPNGESQPLNNRRPAPPVAALYLMRLRAQGLKIDSEPRRTRLQIEDAEAGEETPQPVKIKKVD